MSKQENALQIYVNTLPAQRAAELVELERQVSSLPAEQRFGQLVSKGHLDDVISLMAPPEIYEMTLASPMVFMDEVPFIGGEQFWHRIPEQDAHSRIDAYHLYLEKHNRKTHPHGTAALPPTMRDSGCGYAEVRDPVKTTGQLASVLRAILESDREDDWKLECLFQLDAVMIAGALRLNDQMDGMQESINALVESYIDDRDCLDQLQVVPASFDQDQMLLEQRQASKFKVEINYWLARPWKEHEQTLGDIYLEHESMMAASEEDLDLAAEALMADADIEAAFSFDVSDEQLKEADAEADAVDVSQSPKPSKGE